MKFSFLQCATITAFLSATQVSAEGDPSSGLYKGLDALDGSIDYLSISPIDTETYELRIVPSVISLCTSGRGWIVAEGKVTTAGTMQRQNSRVFCEGEDAKDIADRELTLDPDLGIIRYGATDDRRPLVYHKVSTR